MIARPASARRRYPQGHGSFVGGQSLGDEIGDPVRRLFIGFE